MGSLVIVAVAFIAILFIPQIQLRGRGPGQNLEKATEAASPEGPITREETRRRRQGWTSGQRDIA